MTAILIVCVALMHDVLLCALKWNLLEFVNIVEIEKEIFGKLRRSALCCLLIQNLDTLCSLHSVFFCVCCAKINLYRVCKWHNVPNQQRRSRVVQRQRLCMGTLRFERHLHWCLYVDVKLDNIYHGIYESTTTEHMHMLCCVLLGWVVSCRTGL